jgi:cytolysin (calcineurin-like family phosphatase)
MNIRNMERADLNEQIRELDCIVSAARQRTSILFAQMRDTSMTVEEQDVASRTWYEMGMERTS